MTRNNNTDEVALPSTRQVTGGEDNDTDDSAAAINRSRKPSSGATAEAAAASATARATLLLPLGNLVVVEVEGGDNSGPEGGASCSISGGSDVVGVVALGGEGGDDTGATATSTEKEQKLVQLDGRFELLHCRGEGTRGRVHPRTLWVSSFRCQASIQRRPSSMGKPLKCLLFRAPFFVCYGVYGDMFPAHQRRSPYQINSWSLNHLGVSTA